MATVKEELDRLNTLVENHIFHINDRVTKLEVNVGAIEAHMSWLKKILGGMLVTMVAQAILLVFFNG